MSERFISAVMLIVAVYFGVWTVLEQPALAWVAALLILASVITVSVVWREPIFESD